MKRRKQYFTGTQQEIEKWLYTKVQFSDLSDEEAMCEELANEAYEEVDEVVKRLLSVIKDLKETGFHSSRHIRATVSNFLYEETDAFMRQFVRITQTGPSAHHAEEESWLPSEVLPLICKTVPRYILYDVIEETEADHKRWAKEDGCDIYDDDNISSPEADKLLKEFLEKKRGPNEV